jgi:hypothetical protein
MDLSGSLMVSVVLDLSHFPLFSVAPVLVVLLPCCDLRRSSPPELLAPGILSSQPVGLSYLSHSFLPPPAEQSPSAGQIHRSRRTTFNTASYSFPISCSTSPTRPSSSFSRR